MKKLLLVLGSVCLLASCASMNAEPEVAVNDNPFQPDYYSSRGIATEGRNGCEVGQVIIPVGMNVASAHGGNCFCNEADQLQCTGEGRGVASKAKGCVVGGEILLAPGQSVDANDACNTCSCEKVGKSKYALSCSTNMSCGN
jgi:hypothetical protein